MDFKGFRFRHNQNEWRDQPNYDKFQQSLFDVAEGNLSDLQNAIDYLSDVGIITFVDDSDNAQKGYRKFHITAKGVHIIEGVESSSANTKGLFNFTFNFNLESLAKIETTLKNQFGLLNL